MKSPPQRCQEFRARLLDWYNAQKRALPWRSNPTPYRVWISEIMLQQTQARTVVPYFNRFIKQFPDIESLARASERDVLGSWSGLGYYGRARNLHKAARQIVEEHGVFPENYKDILALPGIGRYTAGAISSIAFNQAQPAVDGNVRRVLTRLRALQRCAPESFYWKLMAALLPNREASSFNQAMMELGALVCVPFLPRCPTCPVEGFCEARRLGIQNAIPRPRTRRAAKHLGIVALVLQRDSEILLASLQKPGFIPGKWGLPHQIVPDRESAEDAASDLCRRVLGHAIPLVPCARIRHSISHYRMLVWGFYGEARVCPPRVQNTGAFRWARLSSSRRLLTSTLFGKVLQKFGELRPMRGSSRR